MTEDASVEDTAPVLDAGDVFRRTRQIDPDGEYAAVEFYTNEILEMADVLAKHPQNELAGGNTFIACWDDGDDR